MKTVEDGGVREIGITCVYYPCWLTRGVHFYCFDFCAGVGEWTDEGWEVHREYYILEFTSVVGLG